MKRLIIFIIITLVILFVIFLDYQRKQTVCESKGGILLQDLYDWKCVKEINP
jgi:hypothetical protein